MSGDRLEAVAAYLDERIDAGDFPGAVFLTLDEKDGEHSIARGMAVVEPERIAMMPETIFDLASLTKPLATTMLLALEREAGRVDFEQPASAFLPELDTNDKRNITIRHLLTHSSGLPKWEPLYALGVEPARIIDAIARMPLAYPTGSEVVYSDPNFIALGVLLERVAGAPLDELFADRIARPLGLRWTGFRPDARLRPRIAASERGNNFERALAGERASSYDGWRTGVIWGEVHDGNAAFLGGVAGHAGLFGTASETAALAIQFLEGSQLLHDTESFASFRTNYTPGMAEHRSIGCVLASTPDCSAGASMPPDAFGHTGFTGTSVWVDPDARRVSVLLTNRTHPEWKSLPMAEIRRTANDLGAGA